MKAQLVSDDAREPAERSGAAPSEAFWTWDADTHRFSVSAHLAEILGHAPGAGASPCLNDWARLVHPDDRVPALAVWNEHCLKQTRRFESEQRLRNASNGWTRVVVSGQVIERSADGAPQRAAGVIREVTPRTRADAGRRQSDKLRAVGALVAGLTHELNTPIQYIGGNVQFLDNICQSLSRLLELCTPAADALLAGIGDPAFALRFKAAVDDVDVEYLRREMPRALEESLEGIGRVGKILRAVNEFAHPGHEEKVAVDLNHAIQTTITVAQNAWRDVADVVTALDAELPAVVCWVDEINQVVLNLLLNASQAIRESGRRGKSKGTITVTTHQRGPDVEIRIHDTGTGIPEDIRGRIFDPFFTTKAPGNGTGQGLSLARAIVEGRHGGTIGFESELGMGTTFIVTLPIQP